MVIAPTASMPVSLALRRVAVVSLVALLAVVTGAADAAAQGRRARLSDDLVRRLASGDVTDTSVIVTGTPAQVSALARRHGLRVRKALRTGALVEVPAGALEALARDADQLSGNHALRSQMAVTNVAIGADQAWDGVGGVDGVTGRGVGVAIIDSGIADVAALRGRVVASVDFTDDRGRGIDRFGHGTHVAGIVAARARYSENGGVAPDAHLVSLKVLNDEGVGTAADVIQAIDWAVEHRRRYRLRVINMSLGGTPMQSWRDDPICQAVQRAHEAGIVVVASAGNIGKLADGTPVFGGITVPGTCPHSITVGALNTKGTPFRSDDVVASYSSRGPTRYDRLIKPDLVAPGNRIRGLHVPGSTLSREHPELVIGQGRYAELELSGTSMAAGVVSGAVALLIDFSSGLSPLATRFLLQYSSERRNGEPLLTAGAGRLNVSAALAREQPDSLPLIAGEGQQAGKIAYAGISATGIIWGESREGIIWGESSEGIIWGNTKDGIIWGDAGGIIWGESAENVVWGDTSDGIIWGESGDGIIWGESEGIIWGETADGIIWGESGDGIIWGESGDGIIWGETGKGIIWGE